ncbi:hypothetical protein ColLi_12171 [Colletotrichum liriopes]|uniref:Uncharacterized protein n=1 Tax=Colletotrichum liriopes TaxID=708192 RepID=A0AA37H0G8_9PEZI|nr:hypothetical protein ColLi_12171 [Colletotrichum liriopes]
MAGCHSIHVTHDSRPRFVCDPSDHYWATILLFYFEGVCQTLPTTTPLVTRSPPRPEITGVILTLAQDEEQTLGMINLACTANNNKAISSSTNTPPSNNSGNNGNSKKLVCPHVGYGRRHHSDKCYIAHTELMPVEFPGRDAILAKAAKHKCTDACRHVNQKPTIAVLLPTRLSTSMRRQRY